MTPSQFASHVATSREDFDRMVTNAADNAVLDQLAADLTDAANQGQRVEALRRAEQMLGGAA